MQFRSRRVASATRYRRALFVLMSLAIACTEDAPTPVTEDPDDSEATDEHVQEDEDEEQTDVAAKPDASGRAPDGSTRTPDAGRSLDAGMRPADAGPVTSETGSDAGPQTMTLDSAMPTAASFADTTLVPHKSWTCGMPEGIPSPTGAPLVFTAEFEVANIRDVGKTQFGTRQLIELGGGTVDGPKLKATLQKGGLDQPLVLANGAFELEEILTLKTSDGKYIYLRVCGTAPNALEPARIVMDFEAPNGGAYAFLNTAKLVGTRELDVAGKKITLRVHDVGQVAPSAEKVSVDNPAGVVDQTWDCKVDTGTAGKEIYKEVVNIGSSLSVGASKRGNRNIIPITGGTATGRIKGSVLPGGGDFQILDSGFVLDARYTMLSDDKELILVRNCGPASKLIPVFEARSDGPYAFLNENNWVSSSPSIGIGTVTLTISEKR